MKQWLLSGKRIRPSDKDLNILPRRLKQRRYRSSVWHLKRMRGIGRLWSNLIKENITILLSTIQNWPIGQNMVYFNQEYWLAGQFSEVSNGY